MPNLTVYYPTAEQRDAVKDELAGIAATHGFYTIHESQERGSILKLLGGIVDGDIALVALGDEQLIAAINELNRLADTKEVEWIARDAFREIASALAKARSRKEWDF